MQYTIRGIPPAVDDALRERARTEGKSLNEAAVDALVDGTGAAGTPRKRRNLDDIAGTWKADKAVEAALEAQDQVDDLQHNLALHARDKHFDHLPQLVRV